MSDRSIVLVVLGFVILLFGGIVLNDLKQKNKLGNQPPPKNWKWEDDWQKSPQIELPKIEPKITPPTVQPMATASNYKEAVAMAKASGRKTLVFFTANWCGWCTKMKSEMTSETVKTTLNNHILVYVDVDQNRDLSRRFGVQGLPSYMISNGNEEKLRMDSGFRNANDFSTWLSQ